MNKHLKIKTGPNFFIFFLDTTIKLIIFPKNPRRIMISGNIYNIKKLNIVILLLKLFFSKFFFLKLNMK